MATRIQVRRDTAANWTENDPTLVDGEIGFETDTGLFKIGRSNTAWTSLAYAQVAGPAGPEGAVGPVGAVGEQGAPGINGGNGDNGLSAYEIWLNLGNSGSEQDFVDSLAGEDGLSGQNGAAGAPGADGQDGEPANIQNLKFTLNPLVNPNDFGANGYWTNNTTSAETYTSQVDPANFSTYTPDLLVIEKTSTTSSIEIEFDVTINLNYEQNVSAFSEEGI